MRLKKVVMLPQTQVLEYSKSRTIPLQVKTRVFPNSTVRDYFLLLGSSPCWIVEIDGSSNGRKMLNS